MERRFELDDRRSRWATFLRKKRSSGFYGYTALAIAAAVGWFLRDLEWINAESGLGYWLGIIGGMWWWLKVEKGGWFGNDPYVGRPA